MINSGREWDWMDKKDREEMDIKTTSKSEVYWKNINRYELEIGARVATLHKVEDSNGGETIWMYDTEDLFTEEEVEYIEHLLWNDELEE